MIDKDGVILLDVYVTDMADRATRLRVTRRRVPYPYGPASVEFSVYFGDRMWTVAADEPPDAAPFAEEACRARIELTIGQLLLGTPIETDRADEGTL
jgi:hypothetical protein